MNINDVLSQRSQTHGSYAVNAAQTMQIRDIVDHNKMPETVRLALFMIGHKMSRISAGNYAEPDHWVDIIGYATLAKNHIELGELGERGE